MHSPMPRRNWPLIAGLSLLLIQGVPFASWAGWYSRNQNPEPAKTAFLLAVGDPLAFENACPCIKGYAQRDYHVVADLITHELKRPVELVLARPRRGPASAPDDSPMFSSAKPR